MSGQTDLFGSTPMLPEGFRYQTGLITPHDEKHLLQEIRELPFREFQFHGFVGKRRTVSFGWGYDFSAEKLHETNDIPAFLLPVRVAAARFAEIPAEQLQQALVTEYDAGAGIGWHKDKAVFGDIVGISLLAPCQFRLRRKADTKWERVTITAEPRSAYLLRGESRTVWEHSIPPVEQLRYSITFRNLRA